MRKLLVKIEDILSPTSLRISKNLDNLYLMAGTNKKKSVNYGGPAIILLRPQLPENIGTAARAMLNFGLNDLRLVNPRETWPNDKAVSSSAGAIDILSDDLKSYNNLDDAIADLNVLFGTTVRDRKMVNKIISAKEGIRVLRQSINTGLKTGILFGPEKAGLTNDEIAKTDAIIKIYTNSSFGSINLAMAVSLISYEWSIEINEEKKFQLNLPKNNIISKEDLEFFLKRLLCSLENNNFFSNKDKKTSTIRKIRTIFSRNQLTNTEISILHGIVSCLINSKNKNNNN